MALSATTIAEVRTGGSDTLNGGLFDPGQTAGMFTDLTIHSGGDATTATPTVKSASYNFVAGDVNAWLYIASGTNWTPGWYQITSVQSNEATLAAGIGLGFLSTSNVWNGPTTVQGIATVTTPTSGTWTIDYSQQAAAQQAYADLASAGTGLTVSSAAHPFGKQQVGNSLIVTAAGNFNAGTYVIASVGALNVATVVGPTNITTGAGLNGVGGLGGAFASPGAAGLTSVNGMDMFIASGTYSITSATANIAGGCVSWPTESAVTNISKIIGYGSTRGDGGTPPLLQAGNAITTFTIVAIPSSARLENIKVDGATLTSSRGFSIGSGGSGLGAVAYRCTAVNCTNGGFNCVSNGLGGVLCLASGCTTVAAFSGAANWLACVASANTIGGFLSSSGYGCISCISANNTGATSDGFSGSTTSDVWYTNCTAYGNGRDGIRLSGSSGTTEAVNCLSVGNGVSAVGYGYNCNAASDSAYLYNCAGYNNMTGLVNTASIKASQQVGLITLTGDPFTNAAGNDFSLNNTAGAGASCRMAGIPGALAANQLPGLSTLSYLDVGATQHADPPNAPTGGHRLVYYDADSW